MSPHFRELLDLLIRWTHLIAGIMWVGNSLLFNWLDRNLLPAPPFPEHPDRPLTDEERAANQRHLGQIWMLHSGGFYQVEKMFLAPGRMPAVLHWFKWQSYTTWLSGIALLLVVYYASGAAYLIDPAVADLSIWQARGVGAGIVLGGILGYDQLWRALGNRAPRLATAVSLLGGVGLVVLATSLLSGRAAYIHIGVLIGTIMSGNVFLHIVPSQRELVAATLAGRAQDPALSYRAKQRSIHNNYLTFPLLFLMISNHFASTFGHPHPALVLLVLIVAGASVRHVLNIRFAFEHWVPVLGAVIFTAVLALHSLLDPSMFGRPQLALPEIPTGVTFGEVRAVVQRRCVPCHSARPTDTTWVVAPKGVMLDTPQQIRALAEKIRLQAVTSRVMPLGNKTNMTETERALLGRWLDEGARLD